MVRVYFSREQEETLISLVQANPSIYCLEHPDYKKTNLKNAIWRKISAAVKKPERDCRNKWKYLRDYYIKRKRENKLVLGPGVNRKDASICHFLSFLSDPLEKTMMVKNDSGETTNEIDENVSVEVDEDDASAEGEEDAIDDTSSEEEEAEYPAKRTPSNQIPGWKATASTVTSTSPNSAATKPRIWSKKSLGRRKLAPRDRIVAKIQKQNKECHELMKTFISSASQSHPQLPPLDPIEAYFKSIMTSVKNLPPLLQLEAKREISNIVINLEFKALQDQISPPSASVSTAYSNPSSPQNVSMIS
ncbi:unnamed protein product [Bemisia tabaci]|uniref:MADF domain-containing protein n=1 Tax=Bemisia tabaci TaxID=7038 RepID=A0A9P0ADR8_BEMTA|nr:unnamed protein product [Bemisia tabaci]